MQATHCTLGHSTNLYHQSLEALNRKRSIISRFVENYPNASTAVITVGIVAFAIPFFASIAHELFIIGLALSGCAVCYTIRNCIKYTLIPHIWLQNQTRLFIKNIKTAESKENRKAIFHAQVGAITEFVTDNNLNPEIITKACRKLKEDMENEDKESGAPQEQAQESRLIQYLRSVFA
ncbi:MAG: hypothetical protein ACXWM7_00510 [Parachlamydiaceae bacterium]